MFCCFPSGNLRDPLIQKEDNNESVEFLLKRLDLMVRAKRAQAEQYRIDEVENRLRMKSCAKNEDKTGANHYCIERRKSEHYYAQALKQSANLQEAHRQIKNALVNLEVAKNLSASNVTLEELQKEMPTERLDEIMDAFRDKTFEVNQQSSILSQNDDFDLNQEDVEAEVEQLFLANLSLPNVPEALIPKGNQKLILKTE
jgi:hypothetical protein